MKTVQNVYSIFISQISNNSLTDHLFTTVPITSLSSLLVLGNVWPSLLRFHQSSSRSPISPRTMDPVDLLDFDVFVWFIRSDRILIKIIISKEVHLLCTYPIYFTAGKYVNITGFGNYFGTYECRKLICNYYVFMTRVIKGSYAFKSIVK